MQGGATLEKSETFLMSLEEILTRKRDEHKALEHLILDYRERCKYFTIGTVFLDDGVHKKCTWEQTTGRSCPEGWSAGTYDFYGLKGRLYNKSIHSSINNLQIRFRICLH